MKDGSEHIELQGMTDSIIENMQVTEVEVSGWTHSTQMDFGEGNTLTIHGLAPDNVQPEMFVSDETWDHQDPPSAFQQAFPPSGFAKDLTGGGGDDTMEGGYGDATL